MDIYVFSDESGVFDYKHYDWFVYAGMIIIGKQNMDILARRYSSLEKKLRHKERYRRLPELKAKYLAEEDRRKLLNLFDSTMKFTAVIRQKRLDVNHIFKDAKSKQMYLDHAYQIVLKGAFRDMVSQQAINSSEELSILIHEDNHHIATYSKCTKADSIFAEFHEPSYDSENNVFCSPLFKNLDEVTISLHDSTQNTLVRGADIIANTVYVSLFNEAEVFQGDLFHIEYLP